MKKRFTSLLLAVTLIIVSISFSASASQKNFAEEQQSQKLRNELIQAKGKTFVKNYEIATTISREIAQEGSEDQYGGIWFGEDGKLNINIINQDQEAKLEGKDIILHHAKYTTKELNNANDKVLELIKQGGKNIDYYFLLGVNSSSNRVDLSISTDFRESEIKEIIDIRKQVEAMDCVEITYVEDAPFYETYKTNNVYVGSPVYDSGGDYSMAYAITNYNGDVGFITAGHCISPGVAMYSGWAVDKKMGTCTESYHDEAWDLAFVKREQSLLTDKWAPKTITNYSGHDLNAGALDYSDYSWIRKDMVSCVDGRGGHNWGVITNHSASTYERQSNGSFKTVSDRIFFSNACYPGQSGGAVWTYIIENGYYHKKAIGILNAGNGSSGYATNAKYVRYCFGSGEMYSE